MQSVVEELFLKQIGCRPPWFTENVADICDQSLSNKQWKNISAIIFPTLDSTFFKVDIIHYLVKWGK